MYRQLTLVFGTHYRMAVHSSTHLMIARVWFNTESCAIRCAISISICSSLWRIASRSRSVMSISTLPSSSSSSKLTAPYPPRHRDRDQLGIRYITTSCAGYLFAALRSSATCFGVDSAGACAEAVTLHRTTTLRRSLTRMTRSSLVTAADMRTHVVASRHTARQETRSKAVSQSGGKCCRRNPA